MSKTAAEELVLNAVQPRMRLGERVEGLVRVDTGPWLYLAFLLAAVTLALAISGNLDLTLISALGAALCTMRVKGYAMLLTDQALYVVRVHGSSVGNVEMIRPLAPVRFERSLMRIELDGSPFWLRPLYLGGDAENFERRLRAASTDIAVAY